MQADGDAASELKWVTSLDSSVVRAHQHAAEAAGHRTVSRGAPPNDMRKQWRGLATRYDKRADNYRAGLLLGALWTR